MDIEEYSNCNDDNDNNDNDYDNDDANNYFKCNICEWCWRCASEFKLVDAVSPEVITIIVIAAVAT